MELSRPAGRAIQRPAIHGERGRLAGQRRAPLLVALGLLLAGGATAQTGPGPRDEGRAGAGPPTLTTAEIIARVEPSVALIRGRESLGTGFLVAPGLLVTNAHVVASEREEDLRVRFPSAGEAEDEPRSAELIDFDETLDLAFLRVESGLPPLELADSHRFRKGDDVLIIGNPALGPEVILENAVARGLMSGRVTIEGRPFYQLAASVNPGNSGGPVLDDRGRIIGVVTMRATAQEALAFCVPLEDLQAAVKRVQDDADRLAAHPAGPPPRYAPAPGPAHVYDIQIEIDQGTEIETRDGTSVYELRSADEERIVLSHRGWLTHRRRPKADPAQGRVTGGPQPSGAVEVAIDPRGTVLESGEAIPVPLLGDLSALIFDPLPRGREPSWQVSRKVALLERSVNRPINPAAPGPGLSLFDRFGSLRGLDTGISLGSTPPGFPTPMPGDLPGFRGLPPGLGTIPRMPGVAPFGRRFGALTPQPSGLQVTERTHPARELAEYRRLPADDEAADVVRIARRYELSTEEQVEGEPRLQLSGRGEIRFDLKLGLPREVEFDGKVVERFENGMVWVPIRFRARLLEQGDERTAALFSNLLPPTPLNPITAAEVDAALADLAGSDHHRRLAALARLRDAATLDSQRATVNRALTVSIGDNDRGIRHESIRALGVWGDAESRSVLIARLEAEPPSGTDETVDLLIEALGRLGPDAGSAAAIVSRISRPKAIEMLRVMGPAAEGPLLAGLSDPDGGPTTAERVKICELLGECGTEASLAVLRPLANRLATGELGRPAAEALARIETRWPGAEALRQTLAALSSAAGNTRAHAAQRLAEVEPDEAIQAEVARALEKALGDPEPRVAQAAARALATWGDAASRGPLIACLGEPPHPAWREAVGTLAELGPDPEVGEALARVLPRDHGFVFPALVRQGPAAEPGLLALLDHEDQRVRHEAVKALSRLGSAEAARRLRALVAAAEGLEALVLQGPLKDLETRLASPTDPNTDPLALLAGIDPRNGFSRQQPLTRLAEMEPDEAARAEVARRLLAMIDPKAVFHQEVVLRALGVWGDDQARSRLIELAQDRDYRFQVHAAEALAALGPDEPGLRAILSLLAREPRHLEQISGPLSATIEPDLLSIVADGATPPEIRAAAVRLLGAVGTPAARSTLEPLSALTSEEPVARAADAALRAIESRLQPAEEARGPD